MPHSGFSGAMFWPQAARIRLPEKAEIDLTDHQLVAPTSINSHTRWLFFGSARAASLMES